MTADGFADQSLQIAIPTKSRKFESRAWRVKGESARMRRHWDEAEEALRRSLAIAQEIDEPRQLWKSHTYPSAGSTGTSRRWRRPIAPITQPTKF